MILNYFITNSIVHYNHIHYVSKDDRWNMPEGKLKENLDDLLSKPVAISYLERYTMPKRIRVNLIKLKSKIQSTS